MRDLISRRAAIKAIDDLPNCYNGYSDTYDKAYIIGVLEELPTIEPERKKGKWKPFDLTWGRSIFSCSCCGDGIEVPTECGMPIYRFCPNCGAKMVDPQESEVEK